METRIAPKADGRWHYRNRLWAREFPPWCAEVARAGASGLWRAAILRGDLELASMGGHANPGAAMLWAIGRITALAGKKAHA